MFLFSRVWNWVDVSPNVFVYYCNVTVSHCFFSTELITLYTQMTVFRFCRYQLPCECMRIVCINTNMHNTHCVVHVCFSCSALGLWFFIRRGKQCLDFTVTVHLFHMIFCWIYNSHPPAVLSWWLVNVACIALMAVIGEYLCMRTELRAIPVNSGPKSNLWIFCWQSAPQNWFSWTFLAACRGWRGWKVINVNVLMPLVHFSRNAPDGLIYLFLLVREMSELVSCILQTVLTLKKKHLSVETFP